MSIGRIGNGYQAMRAYGSSKVQEEALMARTTPEKDAQVRIAEHSDNRLVLLNLSMNEDLTDDAAKMLYSRGLDYVTSRLDSLGYQAKK